MVFMFIVVHVWMFKYGDQSGAYGL